MRLATLALVLLAFAAVPWVNWTPADGFSRAPPRVTGGDEPHYLLAVNSLLRDRDLLLGDDYRRVLRGGAGAGLDFRGRGLDHHTILIDPRTGAHELWQRVYDWRTATGPGEFARLRPGFEGALEVPAHPPAFPALVALLLLPGAPGAEALEPWAIGAVSLLCFLAALGLYLAARRAGLSEGQGSAAVLLAAVASPMLAYARSFFSEPAIAAALAFALWALLARRPALCGALCFAAAAFKPPFGLVALGWAALRLREGRREEAARLLGPFAACCAGLAAFNLRLAHTPIIGGTAGFVPARGMGGLGALLFGSTHGLFVYVPWAAAGSCLAARAAVRGEPGPLRDLAWGAAPVLLVLAAADVEAGGFCYGPRYFVPLLPWLALATAVAFREARGNLRAVIACAAALGFAIAVPGALRYRDLFDRPLPAAFAR